MKYKKFPKDIKLAVYSFIIGFFISFLIGAFTGNPLGIISLRAFVSAFLFGGLMYSGFYLLRRYIPELEIVTAKQKAADLEASEDVDSGTAEHSAEDAKTISHHIRVEETDEIKSGEEGERETGFNSAQVSPATEEETAEEALPSLDRLFEDEDRVPDTEIEQEVTKKDKRIIGDYINLGDVRIPNEPEVMAKAIKKVMSQDER
jgi:hypothetical protein